MTKIRLYDKIFSHASCVGNNYETAPKHFEWVRSGPDLPVCVFTDFSLGDVSKCTGEKKVAWLVESPEVFPGPYEQIVKLADAFDVVLTFDGRLLERGPKFRRYYLGGCWIRRPKVGKKRKDVSIIASNKQTTIGQKMRQEILATVEGIDKYGRGTNEIAGKGDGLWPYRFSIAVENCRKDFYFTEKIVDCFATGTVPIYWGCPSIAAMFDGNGIARFDTLGELRAILHRIETTDDYTWRLPAIRNNFENAKRYMNTEDCLWEDWLQAIVEGVA